MEQHLQVFLLLNQLFPFCLDIQCRPFLTIFAVEVLFVIVHDIPDDLFRLDTVNQHIITNSVHKYPQIA